MICPVFRKSNHIPKKEVKNTCQFSSVSTKLLDKEENRKRRKGTFILFYQDNICTVDIAFSPI